MTEMILLPPGAYPIVPLEKHSITVPEIEVVRLVAKLFPPKLDTKGVKFPNPVEARADIIALEQAMNRASSLQLQIKTTHYFINGIYSREVFIPKGTLLVGRFHKHSCISIMNKGDKSTVNEDGAIRIKAPFATISKAGIKRVGYAHEDTIWTTIHATDERDLKKVEEELFCDRFEDVPFDDESIQTIVTSEGKICRQ